MSVLLVDDHPLLRRGMKAMLNGEDGIEVVAEAEDGLAALQRAQEQRIDLVIMDVSMPRLGGPEATRRLLQSDASLRILALSVHDDPALARQLLAAGASGYVLKRTPPEELVRAVRAVAAGETYVDPTMTLSIFGSASHPSEPLPTLSERECQVLRLMACGHACKEIAESLDLSPRTLETYKARAMTKLQLKSRAELVRYATRAGWLGED